MTNNTVLSLDLPGIEKLKSGKVREIFDLGQSLLFVASDRISAFDVIMPNGIPRKGEVLTQISHFWFEKFSALVPNHLLAKANDPLPKNLQPFADKLARRAMIDRGRLFDVPTYRWIPAKRPVKVEYWAVFMDADTVPERLARPS